MMQRQRGYSLIEVIIAFALLAMALTLLLGTLSGAARQVRQSAERSRAALYAQSLMAAQGLDQPLAPGRSDGSFEDGHFHWTLEVRPYQDPHSPPTPAVPAPAGLLELDLQLAWGPEPGQRLQWRTLRMVLTPMSTGMR